MTTNLPLQLTSFIGREREIAEVKRLLTTTRLLTLTGSGGAGKTRLALQVAADVCDSFSNGVWFIDLAPLADPMLVHQTTATVFGLREQGNRTIADTLRDYFHEKHLLLILDNCEHLIDACAHFVDDVLRTASQVSILATSREPLSIAGETTFRAPSLSIPDIKNSLSLETIAQSDAVRLFVARASAARSTFVLTEQNARAVAQICHRLDGMPLALELAAARIKALSVEEIAARLDNRFNLLTGGSRVALPRQQTLRATMDWSYDLLTEQERGLLRRLSVFAGGWTLQAIESVCAEKGIEASEVFDLLTRLVDKSLVIAEEHNMQSHYWMLETIRQYGHEKLLELGELNSVRDRHLVYFLRWAEMAESRLHSPEQAAWLNQLETENDNLRAALEWSIDKDDRRFEAGLRLAGALGWFWWLRVYWNEGRIWFERFLARKSAVLPNAKATRAKALLGASSLAIWWQDDYARSDAWVEESLSIYRELGDSRGIGIALYCKAMLAFNREDYHQTMMLAEESAELLRQVGDEFNLSWALRILGYAAKRQRDYERATKFFQDSLALSQATGDKAIIARTIIPLGEVMQYKGDYAQARKLFEDGLAYFQELGSKVGIAETFIKLSQVAIHDEEYDKAVALCEEVLGYFRALEYTSGMSWALDILGLVACRMREYPKAVALFKEALPLNIGWNANQSIAENLAGLGAVSAGLGQLESATRLCGAAEALIESVGVNLGPTDREEYDCTVSVLLSQLEDATFNKLWADGRAMTKEQAIDYVSTLSFTVLERAQPTIPSLRQKIQKALGGLTPRERQVAILVARGKTNRDIASELVLSERTAENHVGNILSKLEMHSRSQIAAWVVEKGLHKSKS